MKSTTWSFVREVESPKDSLLIHRGLPHEPSTIVTSGVSQSMIYRGVVHDGTPREAPVTGESELIYRGVRHVR